jgi:hypothetical protein
MCGLFPWSIGAAEMGSVVLTIGVDAVVLASLAGLHAIKV